MCEQQGKDKRTKHTQKQIIRKIIEKRHTSIKNMKEKLINLKGLKKFLVQVKFGKSIDKLPYNIRKEYGFSSDEEKEKEKIKETKKTVVLNLKKHQEEMNKINSDNEERICFHSISHNRGSKYCQRKSSTHFALWKTNRY